MIFKDYYKIMGVSADASLDEIKKTYRKLAMLYHPDRNPNDKSSEDKFKEIVEAYDVLSDEEKRREFDNIRSLGRKFSYQSQNNSNNTYSKDTDFNSRRSSKDIYGDPDIMWNEFKSDYSEKFSDFFKNFFYKKDKNKGKDKQVKLTIGMDEAYKGSSRILILDNKKYRLRIKPGIQVDQLLKIKGKGLPATSVGEKPGDLYIRIKIKPLEGFVRKGNDIYTEKYIDIYDVMLGSKVMVKNIVGEYKINIPKGIAYGKTLRFRHKGFPSYSNPSKRGDFYVKIKYKVPVNLSQEERELIEKLQKINNIQK